MVSGAAAHQSKQIYFMIIQNHDNQQSLIT
jgi:hypothetical protein